MNTLTLPFSTVTSLERFIRARWMHMGRDGGLDGIEAAGGPTANTVRALCQAPGVRQRRSDAPDRLAIFLGFDHWDDLVAAWQADDVTRDLGYVKLSDAAHKIAVDAAKAAGKSLDQWVSSAVVATANVEPAEAKKGK